MIGRGKDCGTDAEIRLQPESAAIEDLHEGWRSAAGYGAERPAGIYQFSRRAQQLAAGAGAESGDRPARRRVVQACQPRRGRGGRAAFRHAEKNLLCRRSGAFPARVRVRAGEGRGPDVILRRLDRPFGRVRRADGAPDRPRGFGRHHRAGLYG